MSVKGQLVSGVAWTALSKYAGIFIGIFISMVLSRLLSPKDFGTIGVASVIISFFGMFSELGISTAIIQRKDLTKADLESIFSFTTYLGALLAFLFFLSSYAIAGFYEDKILLPICQLLSLNLLFGGMSIVPGALLSRDKEFRFVAIRNLVVQIVLGIVSIVLAFAGFGIWTLLISGIGGSLFSLCINLKARPQQFHFRIDFTPIRSIASYSLYQFLFGFVNFMCRNLDNLLIGKYISLKELGYYQKSYGLMTMPLSNITNVITPVLQPILSDYQNDLEYIKNALLKITRLLAALGFPVSVIMFFCAKEIILVLFGNQWVPAIPVFQIMALTIGMQIIGCTFGSIFQAANNTRLLFYVGLINTMAWLVFLFIALIGYGTTTAVAWAFFASTFGSFLFNWPYMFYFLFHSSVVPVIKACLPGFLISGILIAVLWPLSIALEAIPLLVSLIIKGVLSCAILGMMLNALHVVDMKQVCLSVIAKVKHFRQHETI